MADCYGYFFDNHHSQSVKIFCFPPSAIGKTSIETNIDPENSKQETYILPPLLKYKEIEYNAWHNRIPHQYVRCMLLRQ